MANDRLRSAVLQSGVGVQGLADAVNVDRKTVERWIGGRVPYRRHMFAVAAELQLDVAYLWPDARPVQEVQAIARAEVVEVYPHRSAAPRTLWLDTFGQADSRIDMLVMAGFWLSEDRRFRELLAEKASRGVRVRIALGDPDCAAVRQRGEEEGIGDAIAGKIRNVLHNYGSLMGAENVEFRLHDTVLYNSIYRADDELLANAHIHGAAAYEAPILHLRRLPEGDLFRAYSDSFERIWSGARRVPDSLVAVA